MKKFDIQLYALPKELFSIIEKLKQELGFQIAIMKLFPNVNTFKIKSFKEVTNLDIALEDIDTVFLGLQIPEIDVKHQLDFLEKNSDFLTVNIGKFRDAGLEQSRFSGITEDFFVFELWKELSKHLKKNTFAGVWAINTESGDKHYYKNIRYTSSACELSHSGIKLLTDGSYVHCFVDKDCPDTERYE